MLADPSTDDHVEIEIANCLDAHSPRSFFLYAGAGSGKTRSLVNAVIHGKTTRGNDLALRGQQFAVITFTNAAADEISSRLDFDPLVRVSTIHSFAWDLVQDFQEDIRDWVKADLTATVAELASRSSAVGSKKENDRIARLQSARDRITTLDQVSRFTYNPTATNRGRAALNHSQVITVTAHLLNSKPLLRQILVARHPILFIDESQDTNKDLLEAFMLVAAEHDGAFVLGLFGDTMQRIYNNGKPDLERSVPAVWATPVKVMNHRSPERLVRLSNRIRSNIDDHPQRARADRGDGIVRLFIAPADSDVETVEAAVAQQMAAATRDPEWATALIPDTSQKAADPTVKRLILEHHMAAQRLGFQVLFTALNSLESDNTSLLDGSIPGLEVFLKQVAPLIDAHIKGDHFRVARIAREHSPLISRPILESAAQQETSLRKILDRCQAAVDQLTGLWEADKPPTLHAVASVLDTTGLFPLASPVKAALAGAEPNNEETAAWQACLTASFSELNNYGNYINGFSPFATHQGVKGLEFPRVMVVISDTAARGFMFSYEKLLGAKPPTKTDMDNQTAGRDSSLDRTRRLMYVTCSRATQSLAVVAYTNDPGKVQTFATDNDWFGLEETVLI